ncbi:hypothetical protein ASG72_15845 [Bosea sp. Leaf344]|uniref:DUF983 domain-containing protein n=1 Tax=Bosea sp. Leaf344 TaxID=1736346 RepID=UPI00070049E8|nr:DUF983 domain-containing protein [Bosea sp. Leaf344]KQU51239.1 hypothetical protein ASG72_15845 [Bosea sp. Leaf344]
MSVQINHLAGRPAERDWRSAIGRGMTGRCPHCGQGRLFRAFLKPVDHCEACGEAMHHQRADDLPPYIVITIVGHVIVGGLLMAEKYANWPMWLHLALWPALTVLLSLALMQPAKGAVIGLQWALRMHGFGGLPDAPEREPTARTRR